MSAHPFPNGQIDPNPSGTSSGKLESLCRRRKSVPVGTILPGSIPTARPERRCRVSRRRIRAALLAVLAACPWGTAHADDMMPIMATNPDGGLEILGLPPAGHGVGPVTFHLPGVVGYMRSVGRLQAGKGFALVSAKSIFLDAIGSVWSAWEGARLHASAIMAAVDGPSGQSARMAVTGLTVGVRPGSRFAKVMPEQVEATSLASIGELAVRYTGMPSRDSLESTGIVRKDSARRSEGKRIEVVARDIRLAGTVANFLIESGGSGSWSKRPVIMDAVLAMSIQDRTLSGAFGLLIKIGDVPSVKVSGDFQVSGDRKLNLGIQRIEPSTGMSAIEGSQARSAVHSGIRLLDGAANQLAMMAEEVGPAGEHANTPAGFGRFEWTTGREFNLSF